MLENTDDYEDVSGKGRNHSSQKMEREWDASNESHRLLFGDTTLAEAPFDLSSVLKDRLLSVYKDRVDCLFKPLHWPSTISAIRQQGVARNAVSHALEYSLYFTSACTLFNHELDQRQSIVENLRRQCENSLVRAGLVTTTSFTLLQAFVVYLVSQFRS